MLFLLDTRHQVEMPEGIDLTPRPAGLMVGIPALSFGLMLRGLILGLQFIVLAMRGKLGAGLGSLQIFAVSQWYMVPFEVSNQGCSLGEQWMGRRVVPDDGTPIDSSASLLRNLLRFVYLLPFGYSSARSVVYNTRHPLSAFIFASVRISPAATVASYWLWATCSASSAYANISDVARAEISLITQISRK